MENIPKAAVLMARCTRKRQAFGIRMEEQSKGHWIANWAFAIKEKLAKKGNSDNSSISGDFRFTGEYPGCPHCGSCSVYTCMCENVACWDGESRQVTCPWCDRSIQLEGTGSSKVSNLKTSSDR